MGTFEQSSTIIQVFFQTLKANTDKQTDMRYEH